MTKLHPEKCHHSLMIAIIGAGAAGLSTAYHLKKLGLPFKIFEKDSAGSTWGKHYRGLKLHSLKQVSALPGLAMPADYPPFPSGPQMKAYLQSYAEHFDFPIEQCEITSLTFSESEKVWHLESTSGTHSVQLVVVTTGIWNSPKYPQDLKQHLDNFKGQQLQAKDYRSPTDVEGTSVLVVGAGNSGAEIASQLAEAGRDVSILVRDGLLVLPYPKSVLGSSFTAKLFKHLPQSISNSILKKTRKGYPELALPLPSKKSALEAYPVITEDFIPLVKQNKIQIVKGIQTINAKDVTFDIDSYANSNPLAKKHNSTTINPVQIDSIIFAIGYSGHFAAFENFDSYLESDTKGFPLLDNYQSTLNPQLFCVGYDYPATAAWLQAIKGSSKEAANQIAKRFRTIN